MTTFGDDLIQSLGEALAHVQGDGNAIVHARLNPHEISEHPSGSDPTRVSYKSVIPAKAGTQIP